MINGPNKLISKSRYDWLDIIKAICIIFVVLFHIQFNSKYNCFNLIFKYLGNISSLFKVTIFYCVAGITLNNEKIKNTFQFLLHKFKKLYLKIIVIGVCSVLLHNFFIKIGFYDTSLLYYDKVMTIYNLNDYLINIVKTLFLANREVILGAFWFANSLMICFIMISCIEFVLTKLSFIKNKRECRLFISFILMFASIFMSNVLKFTIPRFNNSLVGLFLLDLTNYFYTNKNEYYNNKYLIFVCLICFTFAPFFGEIAMNSNTITSPYFLIIVVMAIFYLLIIISKKMEKTKLFNCLKYVGKNSFSIMAFHFVGFKIAGLILKILGFNTNIGLLIPMVDSFFLLVYYLLFGIIISLLIGLILKKMFKFEL